MRSRSLDLGSMNEQSGVMQETIAKNLPKIVARGRAAAFYDTRMRIGSRHDTHRLARTLRSIIRASQSIDQVALIGGCELIVGQM